MLPAEALCAVTGLFPDDPPGPRQGMAARALPGEWRAHVKQFFDQGKPRKFRLYPRPAHEATLDKLVAAPDNQWLTSRLQDPDIAEDYLVTFSNAREYVRARWPSLSMDTFAGPRLLEPGKIAMMGAWSILAVIEDPTRLLVEMLSGTPGYDQVVAVEAVYPSLFKMLLALIQERKQMELARKKSWQVPWTKERVLRIVMGLPPDVSVTEAPQAPARAARPTIKIDFTSTNTRAQRIEAK